VPFRGHRYFRTLRDFARKIGRRSCSSTAAPGVVAARRWKRDINENAWRLRSAAYPEANYNEICGWGQQ
jgi:hypothetical protein